MIPIFLFPRDPVRTLEQDREGARQKVHALREEARQYERQDLAVNAGQCRKKADRLAILWSLEAEVASG
jgi:hypothetical protein